MYRLFFIRVIHSFIMQNTTYNVFPDCNIMCSKVGFKSPSYFFLFQYSVLYREFGNEKKNCKKKIERMIFEHFVDIPNVDNLKKCFILGYLSKKLITLTMNNLYYNVSPPGSKW